MLATFEKFTKQYRTNTFLFCVRIVVTLLISVIGFESVFFEILFRNKIFHLPDSLPSKKFILWKYLCNTYVLWLMKTYVDYGLSYGTFFFLQEFALTEQYIKGRRFMTFRLNYRPKNSNYRIRLVAQGWQGRYAHSQIFSLIFLKMSEQEL